MFAVTNTPIKGLKILLRKNIIKYNNYCERMSAPSNQESLKEVEVQKSI